MKGTSDVKIGSEFRPAVQFKRLYQVYMVMAVLVFILPWLIPVIIFAPYIVNLFISLPVLFIIVFWAYWIPKYYRTIIYRLTHDEMIWRRGVWFKNTGVVPYNRITNIDIAQGPISRNLRIAALKIQTAGYSAPSGKSAEIKIEGMKNYEELRELIMGCVRGRRPVAVESYGAEDTDSRILNELVKIRRLLETPRRKRP